MALTKIPTHMLFSGAASEDLSIDSDTLFIDSSANRVGIANNSPSVALDVTGALTVSGAITGTLATAAQTNITSVGTLTALTGGTGDLIWDTNTLFVDSSANKIYIGDTASHTDDFLQIETPASGGGHGIQIRRNDSNTDQGIGRILFGNNTDTDLVQIHAKTDGANDNGALIFSTQPDGGSLTERMRITHDGDVNIPVDSAKLQLGAGNDLQLYHDGSNSHIVNEFGAFYIDQGKQDGNLILRCDDMSGGLHDYFYLDGGSGSIKGKAIRDIEWTSTATNSTAGHHIFKSYNTEIMRIDGANNRVGIGTDSPDTMLHLYKATGSGALEPELKIENNHNTSSVTDGAGRLTFYSDDSNNSGIPDLAWLGQVRFMGDDKDGSATEFEYAYMVGQARDAGSGTSRKGGLSFYTRNGNSIAETMTIDEETVKSSGGYKVRKNATTELSGSAHLDVGVKFAAYQYVVTATDISNGYADVEHKVYRDNYIGQVLSMFDVSANVVYTDLGNGSDWATYARRFASGDITRVGLGNDVVAGDKIKMIVFFHGEQG